ncbi:hypothetical protein OG818_03660 [Streptomyces virginiae]|uniref:hypothetical protein n=1 Tax=Streptomyces virginiae TaxID=1961 RepID=UPI00225A96D9|nr:hypothetical protein [Streptomyces virginiae]MCX4714895.1 hypothetical protein [Streptomyces virginiae]
MNDSWPVVAELDAVRRLRVIARATPGTTFAERPVDAPFDRVWGLVRDLEHQMPLMIGDIRSFTVTSAVGERLEAMARSPLGMRARFDIVLRPGWCLMRSRFVIGGMAAVAEGDGTRLAFFGGLRLPGIRLAQPVLRPLMAPLGARALGRLTDQLEGPGG